jgi:hypothetical protein
LVSKWVSIVPAISLSQIISPPKSVAVTLEPFW